MYNNTLITQYNTNTCTTIHNIIQIHVQQYINKQYNTNTCTTIH